MFKRARIRRCLGAALALSAIVISLVTLPASAAPTLRPGQTPVTVEADDGSANPSRVPKQVNAHIGDDPSTQINFTYTTVVESTTQVVINKQGNDEKTTLTGTAGVGQGGKYFHAIGVCDLEPDTVYEYTVGYGENTYSGKFKTALPFGSRESFKFAYLADTQVSNAENARALGATLNEVNNIPDLDFVYIAGDVTDTAASEIQWEYLFNNSGLYPDGGQDMFGSNTLVVTQGNHDNNVMYRHINAPAQMGNIVYSFDYGPATFIILNLESARSDATARSNQEQFLRDAVADAKSRGQWTLVGFHKSLITGASHITDSDVVDARKYWIPIFGELDIDFVLQGHDHVYSRGFVDAEGQRAYDEKYGVGETAPDPENAPLYMIGGHAGGLKWYSRKTYTVASGDPLMAGYEFLDLDSANAADNEHTPGGIVGGGSDVKQEQVIVEMEVTDLAVNISTYMFKYDTTQNKITTDKYLYDQLTITRTPQPRLTLQTDAASVRRNALFNVSAGFDAPVESNVAEMDISFDKTKFEYRGFTPADGSSLIAKEDTDEGVKLIVMTPGYDTTAYGDIQFRANTDANLTDGTSPIRLELNFVVRDDDGKRVKSTYATTGVDTADNVLGDVNNDGVVSLVDISDVIDAFGFTSEDSEWNANSYYLYDFNDNGAIDIQDIAAVAVEFLK